MGGDFLFKSSELKNMEVINLSNNERMGYVSDFEICISDGQVSAIYVPYKTKLFYGKNKNEFRIPWGKISGIGKDIILVDFELPTTDEE